MIERLISLQAATTDGSQEVPFKACNLVIAGWTGRNAADVEAHIAELKAIGVPPPKQVPMFYRVGLDLLTSAPRVQVAGKTTSGEAEVVIYVDEKRIWVGIGSDHTDRKLETAGVTLSKQVCAKPVSRTVWPMEEVAAHWDDLRLESLLSDGTAYQDGAVARLRHPQELLDLYRARSGASLPGTIMFCGTMPVHGEIRYTAPLTLRLTDPVLGRTICHNYTVDSLPIAEE